jgi:hypothetical protein
LHIETFEKLQKDAELAEYDATIFRNRKEAKDGILESSGLIQENKD